MNPIQIQAYTLETFPGVGQGKEFPPDPEPVYHSWPQDNLEEKAKYLQFTTKALWEEYVANLTSSTEYVVTYPPKLETIECVKLDLSYAQLTDEHIIPLAELIEEQGKTPTGKKIHKLNLLGNEMRLEAAIPVK